MLKRLLHGYIAFALANADEYQLTFMVTHASLKHHEEKKLDRPAEEQPVALQVFLTFRDQVAKLIADGVLRPVDATVTTQMLWGALHGLCHAAHYASDLSLGRSPSFDRHARRHPGEGIEGAGLTD